jgi:hypothetical protein
MNPTRLELEEAIAKNTIAFARIHEASRKSRPELTIVLDARAQGAEMRRMVDAHLLREAQK